MAFLSGVTLAGLAGWYAATNPHARIFGRSVAHGPGRRRCIALTFDNGPGPQTWQLLHYLASQNVRATFFVCGRNVQRHPDILRLIAAAGHEVGNHTHTHPRLCPRLGWKLNLLSPSTVAAQVTSAQHIIVNACGVRPRLVRAPYGLRWWGLARAQKSLVLLHIAWTVIGHDWEWEAQRVAAHVLRFAAPGGILCLHDGRDTRPKPDISVTLAAVRIIVPELKRQGFQFETVTDLLRTDEQATQAAG